VGLDLKWNRRSFMGSVGMLAGSLLTPRKIFASKGSTKITGFGQSGNPYEELGVKTVIDLQSDGSSREKGMVEQAGMSFYRIPMTTSERVKIDAGRAPELANTRCSGRVTTKGASLSM